MKHHPCFFAIFSLFVLGHCQSPPAIKRTFENCRIEVGLPKGNVDSDDPRLKCHDACIMRHSGFLINDKLSIDRLIQYALKVTERPNEDNDFIKSTITECARKANEEEDVCETAEVFWKCWSEKINTFNDM